MAGQDFAQIESLQPEEVRPMGEMKIMMFIMASLLVLAASFAGGFMMGREQGVQEAGSRDEVRMLAQLKQQKEELAALRAQAASHLQEEVSTTQVGDLTFYNELPKQSVQPAPLQPERSVKTNVMPERTLKDILEQELKKESTKKALIEAIPKQQENVSDQAYQLQIASFQQKKEAGLFIVKLKDKAITATIQQVELPKIGIWYRVYSGDYATRAQATQAQEKMKADLNISSIIVNRD